MIVSDLDRLIAVWLGLFDLSLFEMLKGFFSFTILMWVIIVNKKGGIYSIKKKSFVLASRLRNIIKVYYP